MVTQAPALLVRGGRARRWIAYAGGSSSLADGYGCMVEGLEAQLCPFERSITSWTHACPCAHVPNAMLLTHYHTISTPPCAAQVRLLLAASTAMGPLIRRFICLGLNRVWLKSGDVAYRQGELLAVCGGWVAVVRHRVYLSWIVDSMREHGVPPNCLKAMCPPTPTLSCTTPRRRGGVSVCGHLWTSAAAA